MPATGAVGRRSATRSRVRAGDVVCLGPIGIKGVPGPRKLPAAVADEAIGRQLWEASERLSGVHYQLNQGGGPEGDR
jgi:hypothetical protein